MRSQWTHRDGWTVSVFAYPLRGDTTPQRMRAEYLAEVKEDGTKLLVQDSAIPAPFGGYRFIREAVDDEGERVEALDYFIEDDANADVHQLMMVVGRDELEEAEATLENLNRQRPLDRRQGTGAVGDGSLLVLPWESGWSEHRTDLLA